MRMSIKSVWLLMRGRVDCADAIFGHLDGHGMRGDGGLADLFGGWIPLGHRAFKAGTSSPGKLGSSFSSQASASVARSGKE